MEIPQTLPPPEEEKPVNLSNLRQFLGTKLPRTPSFRRIYEAIDMGMPFERQKVGGGRLFYRSKCWAWWFEKAS